MPDSHQPPDPALAPGQRSVIDRVRMAAAGGPAGATAPALEQQIAALAAQVRSLGQRLAGTRPDSASTAPEVRLPLAPEGPPLVSGATMNANIFAIAEA